MSITNVRRRPATHAALAGALLLATALALATVTGLLTSTPVHAQTPAATPSNASTACLYASKPFPQGTAIRPTHHPELLQVCGTENAQPRWFKTTEQQVHDRNTPIVAVDDTPDPQSLACKVTAPENSYYCTCDHLRSSPGSVVNSPQGKLVCPASTGRWQPYEGKETPYPPPPANPVPLAQ